MHRTALAPLLGLLGLSASTAAWAVPLTVRVQDAEGRPGQWVAVVLSTYEPQPIEQGQLCVVFGGVTAPAPAISAAWATFGDALIAVQRAPGGELMIDLASASGTINAQDGAMVTLWFQVPSTARVGTTFPIRVDPAASWLRSDTGAPLVVDPKPGQLTVIPPASRLAVLAEGDNIAPGEDARLSIETLEPIPLTGGDLTLRYNPAMAAGVPIVTTRSRSTDLITTTDLSQPGWIRVHVEAVDPLWNWVPGPLVEVVIPTRAGVPVGTVAPIWIDRASTQLFGASGQPVPLALFPGDVEFR
jgi:hypothetical protein